MSQDKQIVVEGAPNDGRVILWEKDPIHPDGEVYITQGKQVTVGITPAVTALLKTGALYEVKVKAKKAQEENGEKGTPPKGNQEQPPKGAAVSPPATGGKPATEKIVTGEGA